jgi:hypothetical protein
MQRLSSSRPHNLNKGFAKGDHVGHALSPESNVTGTVPGYLTRYTLEHAALDQQ